MSKSLIFLICVAAAVLAVLLLATFTPTSRLEVFDGCPINGSGRGSEKTHENELKNRYVMPGGGDFDAWVDLQKMLETASPAALDEQKAVEVTGYVREVKSGGVESCNCRSSDPRDMDSHLELTPRDGQGIQEVVICEVTPRTRELAHERGEDWSTQALKARFLGRRVTVEGWLFFDPDHVEEAFANNPQDNGSRPNWRGTSWEVHPVTRIELTP